MMRDTVIGLTERFENLWIPVTMYHRVTLTDAGTDWAVTPEVFEQQLSYFKKHNFESLTVAQLGEVFEEKRAMPEKAFVITFDDGYLDNYTTAWPILQKYGYNATIYLVSDYIGQDNRFDRGRIRDCPIMSLEQIRQMQESGIEFGSHTCTHRSLVQLNEWERTDELQRSKRNLEILLDREVNSFAYPYSEMNEICEKAVAEAGYQTAVSGVGRAFRRYCLNRVHLKSQGEAMVALKTSPKVYNMRRTKLYKAVRGIPLNS